MHESWIEMYSIDQPCYFMFDFDEVSEVSQRSAPNSRSSSNSFHLSRTVRPAGSTFGITTFHAFAAAIVSQLTDLTVDHTHCDCTSYIP